MSGKSSTASTPRTFTEQETISSTSSSIMPSSEDSSKTVMGEPEESVSQDFHLYSLIRPEDTFTIIFTIFSTCLAALTPVATTKMLSKIFDDLSDFISSEKFNNDVQEYMKTLKWDCFSLAFIGIGSLIFGTTAVSGFMKLGERQQRRLRFSIYDSLLNKNFQWLDGKGDINGKLVLVNRCIEEYRSGVSEVSAIFLKNVLTVISLTVTSFIFSWRLTLISMASVPFITIFSLILMSLISKYTIKENEYSSELTQLLDWNLNSFEWIKIIGGKYKEAEKFKSISENSTKSFIRQRLYISLNIGLMKTLAFLMFIETLWFGSFLTKHNYNSSGDVFACFYACLSITTIISGLTGLIAQLKKSSIALNTTFKFLDDDRNNKKKHEKEIVDKNSIRLVLTDINNYVSFENGDIKFDNITFHYPTRPDTVILKNVSIDILSNQTTFILGKSGSGKSTIASLLLKLYDYNSEKLNNSGFITIDRYDISHLTIEQLTNNITLVEQKTSLFNGSIKENLLLGSDYKLEQDITDDEFINKILEITMLRNLIDSLADGMDTIIGNDSGIFLSGGQQQRIAIARALIRDTPILILDEATSALDSILKEKINKSIREWRNGRTTIIITHDYFLVDDDDFLYFMKEGQVVESGYKKDLLLNDNSIFKKMSSFSYNKDDSLVSKRNTKYNNGITDSIYGEHLNYRSSAMMSNDVLSKRLSTLSTNLLSLMIDLNNAEDELAAPNDNTEYNTADNADEIRYKKEEGKEVKGEEVKEDLLPVRILLYKFRSLITSKWSIIFGMIATVLANVCNPIFSYTFSKLINGVVPTQSGYASNSYMIQWSFTVIGIIFADGIFTVLSTYLLGYGAEKMVFAIRQKSFNRILIQNIIWFSKCKPSETIALIVNDARDLRSIIYDYSTVLVGLTILTSMGAIWSLIIGWKLALVGLSFIPLFMIAGIFYSIMMKTSEDQYKTKISNLENYLHETVIGIRTINYLNIKQVFIDTFNEKLIQVSIIGNSRAFKIGLGISLVDLLIGIAQSVLFYYGLKLILENNYTLIQVMQIITLILFSIGNTSTLLRKIPLISRGQRAGCYILKLLELPSTFENSSGFIMPEYDNNDSSDTENNDKVLIDINNLNFAYESNPNLKVLKNLNLKIYQNEVVSIVGESGSGKSTLISLILNLYELRSSAHSNSGNADNRDMIKLLGVSINSINPKWFHENIAVVQQQHRFFNGTILENLTYCLPESAEYHVEGNQDVIWDALELVDMREYVESLSDGLNTRMGDQNTSLFSGGQNQRMCIARALIRKPKILVLDECTSALDPENTRKICDLIKEVFIKKLGMTIIIVTHAKELMKISDKIICLKDGYCTETGDFNTLMYRRKYLYNLINSNFEM
ncbi:ATPase activity protein [[Candida] boidinii]|nr:ATPase activity protein [[Candida] boidinii]